MKKRGGGRMEKLKRKRSRKRECWRGWRREIIRYTDEKKV